VGAETASTLDRAEGYLIYSPVPPATCITAAKAAFCVMQYGVLGTLTRPQGRVRCEIDASVPVGVGAEFRGPAVGSIELTNTGAVISARGWLRATAVMECSRCLASHEVELDIEVNEECRLAQIDQPRRAGEEEAQPIPILDAEVVDLSELVRQVLALSIPPTSLCRPDCKGLCPHCGKDLSDGPCSCAQETTDERWAGLRDLVQE